jgi:hypothetical protein
MAMRPTHDLLVKTGSYTDRDGAPKNRWLKIGSRFQRDDGSEAIKLDCLPVGIPEWSGWVSVYPVKDKGAAPPPIQPAAKAESAWDDDMPF